MDPYLPLAQPPQAPVSATSGAAGSCEPVIDAFAARRSGTTDEINLDDVSWSDDEALDALVDKFAGEVEGEGVIRLLIPEADSSEDQSER